MIKIQGIPSDVSGLEPNHVYVTLNKINKYLADELISNIIIDWHNDFLVINFKSGRELRILAYDTMRIRYGEEEV